MTINGNMHGHCHSSGNGGLFRLPADQRDDDISDDNDKDTHKYKYKDKDEDEDKDKDKGDNWQANITSPSAGLTSRSCGRHRML